MKNNKGFISMTLVYSFLTLFLFIMAAIMAAQSEKTDFIDYVNDKVDEDLEGFKDKSSTLIQRMIDDNFVTDGTRFVISDIANNSVGNGNGLYYIDDANKTDENSDGSSGRIYFYRGSVRNNYVQLRIDGSDLDVKNFCFKIIRTNEDGSIRLMYVASKCSASQYKGIGTSYFNEMNNDNAFVGYMMGKAETELTDASGNPQPFDNRRNKDTAGYNPSSVTDAIRYDDTHYFYANDLDVDVDEPSGLKYFGLKYGHSVEYHENESNAKKTIDKWYQDNLQQISYMFSDSVYCADKALITKTGQGTHPGIGNYTSYYFDTTKSSTFKCPQKKDMLSLSQLNGGSNENYNSLKYPIGLLTVSDVLYAGGKYGESNSDYYLNTGYNYWTMTPSSFNTNAREIIVSSDGKISEKNVKDSSDMYLMPVISIKPDSIVASGSGTKNSPYLIEVNSY